jgi:geranylgeranyl diphosphate synthase type I
MDLSTALTQYLPAIEEELHSLLVAPAPDQARHYGIMQYHMGWLDADLSPVQAAAGKRLRPVLCMLACQSAGGDPFQALPAAAGVELLHNFSLIHDDIEDDSDFRRHRPTAFRAFGLPLACNAGDAMFGLAHVAFYRLAERSVPAGAALRALQLFDEMCVELTSGQFLDMSFESRLDVTVDEYFRMIAGKTGALIGAATEIGAHLAGADEATQAEYRRFGRALGLAFQLQDDVLGIWGDEAITGKSAASDILSKKKSLPVVYALADPRVGLELRARYGGPAFTLEDVPSVLTILDRAGARGFTEAQAREALADAERALEAAEVRVGPGSQVLLRSLAASLVGRQT